MKKHNFFSKIYMSMTSTSFYTDIIHEHFFKSFLYLVLLTLIISIPYSAYLGNYTYQQTGETINLINSNAFPDFELIDNTLEIKGDKPFVYESKDNKLFKLIIDKSNTYSFNDLAGYYLGYLITPNGIIHSQLGTTPSTIKYNELSVDVLSKKDLVDYFREIHIWLSITTGVLATIFAVFTTLFKSMFSYFLVSFFKNACALPITFSQAYKIAIYSMTAALIVVEILRITQLVPPTYFFVIFMVIDAIYVGKIINRFNRQKQDTNIIL